MSQQGGNSSSGGRRNPAQNLSDADRRKGGEHSAQVQQRDEFGQFAGRKDNAGRRSSSRSDRNADSRGGSNDQASTRGVSEGNL